MSSDPLFHADLPDPLPRRGQTFLLDGPEGRHAAVVRRIRPGETVVLADGAGRAVTGPVVAAGKQSVTVEVAEQLVEPARQSGSSSPRRWPRGTAASWRSSC